MNTQQHIPLCQIYIGLGASATLREIQQGASKEEVDKFLTSCKNFLIEYILQIQKRFDLKAEYYTASVIPRSLRGICEKLPYLGQILDVIFL